MILQIMAVASLFFLVLFLCDNDNGTTTINNNMKQFYTAKLLFLPEQGR